jgi:adenosylhomocysteine nucleosidase
MSRIAIIAAMERELVPLVRDWKKCLLAAGDRKFTLFESGELIAVVSGIGCKNAELAARAVVERSHPLALMSAGLAGALIRSLKVGSIFTPSVVVDAADGSEYRCAAESGRVSGGVLVSSGSIAGAEAKQELVNRFHALVVDMEAAGVARVAEQEHIGFRCVKAISDETDFAMPPLARFIDAAGDFQKGKFAVWAALRPWNWDSIAALARNSRRAAKALCAWLEKDLAAGLPPGEIVTLKRTEFSEAKR